MSGSQGSGTRLSETVLGPAIVAITGMQLMATLDGTIVIVALPRMQAELALSDAGKSWVITAYVLAFGGLLLLGGRIGDAIGHKRAFLAGVGTFTIASLICGVATDEITLIAARGVQGLGAAVAAPTGLALIATTYAVGHARNKALAVSAAMQGIGSVLGLILGGALTELSWRWAFLINVPIGIAIIVVAALWLAETRHERLTLDVSGALLATLACTAAVLVFTQGPPRGWIDPWVFAAGAATVLALVAFVIVERRADNPLVPFSVFDDRSRVATFVAYFLAGGVMLTVSVMIGLLVQDVLGYSALHAGICFIPFALAMGVGNLAATRFAPRFAPRWLVIGAGSLVLAAMLFGSTLERDVPYFPDLVVLFVLGGLGIGVISVVLPLCAVADVAPRDIGPVSAVTLMVYNLGGPIVLVVIQAVQTSRTLYLGGTTGPVHDMTPAQLDALGHGYTYSLLWVAGIAVLVGVAALGIRFTARQIASAQHTKEAVEAGGTVNPTRRQISDATGALGWRLVLGAIHAQVRVHTLAEAAEVATLAAAACPDASGHLSIDLSADRVVLRVQSEADGVVTDRDLDVAGRLAGALQTAGRTIEPGPDLHAFEIAIDALDIAAVRPFWKAVTGYRDARSTTDLNHGLLDPAGRGPAIWFQQMDSPRHETRNRIHLDVDVPHDQAAVRIAAALAAGGVMLSEHAAPAFWVLADAEGNEACVCTWQGRD